MAAMLQLEAIGPRGEELALAAGEATDTPVGFDPDLDCATFDSSSFDDEGLRSAVLEALAGLDPDWPTHLRVIED